MNQNGLAHPGKLRTERPVGQTRLCPKEQAQEKGRGGCLPRPGCGEFSCVFRSLPSGCGHRFVALEISLRSIGRLAIYGWVHVQAARPPSAFPRRKGIDARWRTGPGGGPSPAVDRDREQYMYCYLPVCWVQKKGPRHVPRPCSVEGWAVHLRETAAAAASSLQAFAQPSRSAVFMLTVPSGL